MPTKARQNQEMLIRSKLSCCCKYGYKNPLKAEWRKTCKPKKRQPKLLPLMQRCEKYTEKAPVLFDSTGCQLRILVTYSCMGLLWVFKCWKTGRVRPPKVFSSRCKHDELLVNSWKNQRPQKPYIWFNQMRCENFVHCHY